MKNKIESAFPQEIEADVKYVIKLIPESEYYHPENVHNITFKDEILIIPEKIDLDLPLTNNLSDIQTAIIYALFSRHENEKLAKFCKAQLSKYNYEWSCIYIELL